jgi:hypothetical protein
VRILALRTTLLTALYDSFAASLYNRPLFNGTPLALTLFNKRKNLCASLIDARSDNQYLRK